MCIIRKGAIMIPEIVEQLQKQLQQQTEQCSHQKSHHQDADYITWYDSRSHDDAVLWVNHAL